MHIDELLGRIPEATKTSSADVRRELDPSTVLIVLDDDPTGTQSVANLPVLTSWGEADLSEAITTGAPAVYVLTNSRALDEARAAAANREVVAAALSAAARLGRRPVFVSRSDSTLRGHFPLETDVLSAEIVTRGGRAPSLTLIIPAFPEAGRITVDSVHYSVVADEATPVGETPFAADATFGYASSNLREWVREKSDGAIEDERIQALTIHRLRLGVDAVEAFLRGVNPGSVVVVDAVAESDLRVVALALHRMRDVDALLRVGPPYVRAHIGQDVATPVSREDIVFSHERGGLVVVGSHVSLTTTQLEELRRERPETLTFELNAARVLGSEREACIADTASAIARALDEGDVIVHTSRELIVGRSGDESLEIARSVSLALVELVQRVLKTRPPRFVIAKGGITSSDIASKALGIRHARVVGPMLPGIVSLWQPEDGPAVGIPYVVFAGNVGDTGSLGAVVDKLATQVPLGKETP